MCCLSGDCSLLLELLDDLGGDSVHVGGTLLGQALAHKVRATLISFEADGANETGSLELDKAVADVLTSGHTSVLSVGAVSLVDTIVLAKSVDSDLLSHVDLVGDGGGAVVEPVTVDGAELSSAGSLDVRSPL